MLFREKKNYNHSVVGVILTPSKVLTVPVPVHVHGPKINTDICICHISANWLVSVFMFCESIASLGPICMCWILNKIWRIYKIMSKSHIHYTLYLIYLCQSSYQIKSSLPSIQVQIMQIICIGCKSWWGKLPNLVLKLLICWLLVHNRPSAQKQPGGTVR